MASSLATQIIGAMRSGDQLVGEQVAVASLQLVSCLALFIGLQLLPCRHAISLHVSLATEAVLTEQHSVSQCVQQFAVLCCVAVSGMRAMVVSGLEVATAMVLESVYGWGLPCIGWCISTSFLVSIPQRRLYNKLKSAVVVATWVRIAMIAAALGSLMLFPAFTTFLFGDTSNGSFVLLFADAVLFPSFMLASGLTEGIAATVALAMTKGVSLL